MAASELQRMSRSHNTNGGGSERYGTEARQYSRVGWRRGHSRIHSGESAHAKGELGSGACHTMRSGTYEDEEICQVSARQHNCAAVVDPASWVVGHDCWNMQSSVTDGRQDDATQSHSCRRVRAARAGATRTGQIGAVRASRTRMLVSLHAGLRVSLCSPEHPRPTLGTW